MENNTNNTRNGVQNRLKSKVVWASIAAAVLSVLVALGVISTGTSANVNTAVSYLLQAFVIFGVLNNPTDSQNF